MTSNREIAAAALLRRRSNGICKLRVPCDPCDCLDSGHTEQFQDADAVLADLEKADRLK